MNWDESRSTPAETRFFFECLRFKGGRLEIDIKGRERDLGTIVFEYVRVFFFFKESDFFAELAKYDHEQIISGAPSEHSAFFGSREIQS